MISGERNIGVYGIFTKDDGESKAITATSSMVLITPRNNDFLDCFCLIYSVYHENERGLNPFIKNTALDNFWHSCYITAKPRYEFLRMRLVRINSNRFASFFIRIHSCYMHNLTERQIDILKNLIEEYIETAEAVGSETLEKKHSVSASPATIRNDMVRLTELGYLKKSHSSAGRVPTSEGMRFYVKQLMKEKELSVVEEVALKEKLWDYRDRTQTFMKELTRALADKTHALAVATTNEGDFYVSGYANILDMPEFYDIDITKSLLSALDESECFHQVCAGVVDDEDVHVLLGDELGPRLSGPYGFVFTNYQTPMRLGGQVGVIGPTRLHYTSVVPMVRYFGDLVEEVAKGW